MKRSVRQTMKEPFYGPLILLSLFFLFGILLGQYAAGRISSQTGTELSRYLTDYVRIGSQLTPSLSTVFSAAIIYFRYPLAALLLGFASIGLLLLPCVTTAYGFFLSFSASCLASAFGSNGVLLAFILFGLRCAVTLPCYFLLAVPALKASSELAAVSIGHGRRATPGNYGTPFWRRLAICVGILTSGLCVDLILSPKLLLWILPRILS